LVQAHGNHAKPKWREAKPLRGKWLMGEREVDIEEKRDTEEWYETGGYSIEG